MKNSIELLLTGVLTTLLFDASLATAQQANVGPVGSSVNRSSKPGHAERVLVLRTGRVMKGRIKTISTGWLVSTDRGNAVIPFDQVHFDADDLNEAYLRLRIQGGKPTVASHLRLAEWCLSQDILAEAARELRDALKKDPANETARLMLNRVDTEIRRRTPKDPEVEQAHDVVIITEQTPQLEDDEVRSLSGLSPESAREFVASIQPLLLNKCGNARCHGPASKNGFQLTRTRSGASNSRVVSERNLAAVLNDLRPEQNGRARLLNVIRASHAGKTIFHGRYGAGQMQTLQRWIKTVASELSFELASAEPTAFSNRPAVPSRSSAEVSDSARADSPAVASDRVQEPANGDSLVTTTAGQFPEASVGVHQNSAKRVEHRNAQNIGRPDVDALLEPGSAKSPTPLSNVQRILQEARQHVRQKDAFDPEDFNRRFAGRRTQ
jgi:hypothetical protein